MIQEEILGPNRGYTTGFNCIFMYLKYLLGSLLHLSLGYILPDSVIIIVYWMVVAAFEKPQSWNINKRLVTW